MNVYWIHRLINASSRCVMSNAKTLIRKQLFPLKQMLCLLDNIWNMRQLSEPQSSYQTSTEDVYTVAAVRWQLGYLSWWSEIFSTTPIAYFSFCPPCRFWTIIKKHLSIVDVQVTQRQLNIGHLPCSFLSRSFLLLSWVSWVLGLMCILCHMLHTATLWQFISKATEEKKSGWGVIIEGEKDRRKTEKRREVADLRCVARG